MEHGWALAVGRGALVFVGLEVVRRRRRTPSIVAAGVLAAHALIEGFTALSAPRRPRSPDVAEPALGGELIAVVSAQLANESAVLLDTVRQLRERGFRVLVTSNGEERRLEHELADSSSSSAGATCIEWTHDPAARTKAENLNRAAVSLDPESRVFLADADTRIAHAAFRAGARCDTSIVQYPRLIRPATGNVFERVIAVEMAFKMLLTYPSRTRGPSVSYLGGSAAIVPTSLVCQIGFREDAFVEDIDFSIRCLLAGTPTEYRTDIVASDLAPPSTSAWLAQRRRWSAGWLQLTSRYTSRIVRAPLSARARLTWTGLLIGRHLLLPVATFTTLVSLLYRCASWRSLLLVGLVLEASVLLRLARVARGETDLLASTWGPPTRPIVTFAFLAVPYTIALHLVELSTLVLPARRWVVTARSMSRT